MKYQLIYMSVALLLLTACNSDDIAVVNGRSIERADFDNYLRYKGIVIRNAEQKNRVLDQYLQRTGLAHLIEEKPVYEDVLLKVELEELRKTAVIEHYFEHFLKEKVDNAAVKDYYDNNLNDYKERRVHIVHILVRLTRGMGENQRKAKLAIVQEAYSKLKAGMSFGEAVKKYSEDAVTSNKGGDLGWITGGHVSKVFSDQAFSVKEGEISEPFETPFGYHILKVIAEPKIIQRSFESAKNEIRYQLRKTAKEAEIQRLLSIAKIEKHN